MTFLMGRLGWGPEVMFQGRPELGKGVKFIVASMHELTSHAGPGWVEAHYMHCGI